MCHLRGVFNEHLDEIVRKLTAGAKLAEKLIQGGNFDSQNSSGGI